MPKPSAVPPINVVCFLRSRYHYKVIKVRLKVLEQITIDDARLLSYNFFSIICPNVQFEIWQKVNRVYDITREPINTASKVACKTRMLIRSPMQYHCQLSKNIRSKFAISFNAQAKKRAKQVYFNVVPRYSDCEYSITVV